jgi:long-subunit acyl-CoA synthetase (AMP-forming)
MIQTDTFAVVYQEYKRLYSEALESYKKEHEVKEIDPLTAESIRKHILSEMKTVLGTRIKDISVGGAQSSEQVLNFLKEVWGYIVSEGYASTGKHFMGRFH